jgi:hypothetical protein
LETLWILTDYAQKSHLPPWTLLLLLPEDHGKWGTGNVQGELVFSGMAAGWFYEKSGWIGKAKDVKPVFLKKKMDFNR